MQLRDADVASAELVEEKRLSRELSAQVHNFTEGVFVSCPSQHPHPWRDPFTSLHQFSSQHRASIFFPSTERETCDQLSASYDQHRLLLMLHASKASREIWHLPLQARMQLPRSWQRLGQRRRSSGASWKLHAPSASRLQTTCQVPSRQ